MSNPIDPQVDDSTHDDEEQKRSSVLQYITSITDTLDEQANIIDSITVALSSLTREPVQSEEPNDDSGTCRKRECIHIERLISIRDRLCRHNAILEALMRELPEI
jgi:hypothetical protein